MRVTLSETRYRLSPGFGKSCSFLAPRRNSEMNRCALEKLAAAHVGDNFSSPRYDLSTTGHRIWPAFDFEFFDGIVITIH